MKIVCTINDASMAANAQGAALESTSVILDVSIIPEVLKLFFKNKKDAKMYNVNFYSSLSFSLLDEEW